MRDFTYWNPTKIVFGRGAVDRVGELVPSDATVLITYGGGSIKRNGVYERIRTALGGAALVEFGGIEPNPRYETLMKAVALAKEKGVDFLLAVGGGSVLDGTKFIAAALHHDGGDPWDILEKHAPVRSATPIGAVLTLPGTGSESNGNAVITREETRDKLAFGSQAVFPRFAVLDPETTFSLPERQTANGVVDAFAHVLEQYMTYDVNAPLQDRQAEALLVTLVEQGPKVLAHPNDYDTRANIMWCATQALNTLIACGVPQDWATHGIGHELTALYGIDHARTLAVVFPALLRHQKERKRGKLLQYAARVWGLVDGDEEARIDAAIEKTEAFFRGMGIPTRLKDYEVTKGCLEVAERIGRRGGGLGEHGDIGEKEVAEIMELCAV